MPDSIVALDGADMITYVNHAAEQLFSLGAKKLLIRNLSEIIPSDSPLMAIVHQSRHKNISISEYDITLGNPKYGHKSVDIHVSPQIEGEGHIIIQLQERSIAQKISQQLNHRGAARSVAGMASVLAHEIKNPLSGIRGSAQLLEQEVSEENRDLTQLICEETDRICALVDQMEVFSNNNPVQPKEINIHQVLEHVRKLAQNGFGRHISFRENYDPSIPSARGDKDQLIQVFLNLIKNAVEAAPPKDGQVTLSSAYRHGVRVADPVSGERLHLPLEICVSDNGPGIPDDLKPCLFDPFVTTKTSGSGLGLALVAKIIGDHGGIIECDAAKGRTTFRILLPSFKGQAK